MSAKDGGDNTDASSDSSNKSVDKLGNQTDKLTGKTPRQTDKNFRSGISLRGHIQGESSHFQKCNQEKPSKACPETNQMETTPHRCSVRLILDPAKSTRLTLPPCWWRGSSPLLSLLHPVFVDSTLCFKLRIYCSLYSGFTHSSVLVLPGSYSQVLP